MTITELYELFIRHPKVTTDSRNCPENSLFFALKGERFDGNRYAAQALDAGCAYAIIDNPAYATGERTILVNNALETLQHLARHHRETLGLPVIGITGTNGKTTTKELIAAVLSTRYDILYTEGNLNNEIGVPLTLLRLRPTHQLAIIEMGASHPGDIQELVEIACPDYGIITNIGRAHLEGFGSFENVLKTKGELYDYIRRTGGKIFRRKEDNALASISEGIETILYGTAEDTFVAGQALGCDPFLSLEWKQAKKSYRVNTHLIGKYNLDNVLAAITTGRYFDVPAASVCDALASYQPTNNRSQLKRTDRNILIIDAYNANPSSMKAALENFATLKASPKAVILGDMKELGPDSEKFHAEIVAQVRAAGFEKAIFCGPHFCQAANGFPIYPTTEELLAELREHPMEGFHILMKGSHSMALEKAADLL